MPVVVMVEVTDAIRKDVGDWVMAEAKCVGPCGEVKPIIAKGLCSKCYGAQRRDEKSPGRKRRQKRGVSKKGDERVSPKKVTITGMSCQDCGAEIDKLLEEYSMMILHLLGIAEDYKENFDRLRTELLKSRQTKLEGEKEKVAKELQPVRVFINQAEKDEKAKGA